MAVTALSKCSNMYLSPRWLPKENFLGVSRGKVEMILSVYVRRFYMSFIENKTVKDFFFVTVLNLFFIR